MNNDILEEVWDRVKLLPPEFGAATEYAKSMSRRSAGYYVSRIQKLGIKGDKVLDAGCGTGTWSFALSKFFKKAYGVDVSKERVEVAKWLAEQTGIENVQFSIGSITELEFQNNTFDAIFCYGVLISAIPIKAALEEFKRVLKPGGVIYICLNGIGWSLYLKNERGKEGQKYVDMGKRGIYNTLCQRYLSEAPKRIQSIPSIPSLGSSKVVPISNLALRAKRFFEIKIPKKIAKIAATETENSARAVIHKWHKYFGYFSIPLPLLSVMEKIADECGEEYVDILADDLEKLALGEAQTFSFSNEGRGYTPEEMEKICREIGLINFQWAAEGKIIGNLPVPDVDSIHFDYFNGELSVWECMVFKSQNMLSHPEPAALLKRAAAMRSAVIYAPEHVPLLTNVDMHNFSDFHVKEAQRLARVAGGQDFVVALARKICENLHSEEDKVVALVQFSQKVIYRHPIIQPFSQNGSIVDDPCTLLFLNIGRCGHVASLLRALLIGADIPAEIWRVGEHVLVTARVGGREIVLDADAFKFGIMLRNKQGLLLEKLELLENPGWLDQLPIIYPYIYGVNKKKWVDLWGREAYGYCDNKNTVLYSTFFKKEKNRRYLPNIPELVASYHNGLLNLSWSTAVPFDNAPIDYDVIIGSGSRGWNYEDIEPEEGSIFFNGPKEEIKRINTVKNTLSVRDVPLPCYVVVQPRLLDRLDVFCWPSNEVFLP